ncbi:PEP-CTERM sorting domain-containing protein [Halochromatium glycolicum]|uniref:PEP-CTERM sorting domain-containing protein n=1 Tax=Halochromatium glycolicum TaxID=85075 RepID=UPI00190C50E2
MTDLLIFKPLYFLFFTFGTDCAKLNALTPTDKEQYVTHRFCLAAALAALGAWPLHAFASPIVFEDLIDYWSADGSYYGEHQAPNHQWDSVSITGESVIFRNAPLAYTHDINDDVDLTSGYRVTEAFLELDFTNDTNDDYISFFGIILWDNREFTRVGFDGSNWRDVGEVDTGDYTLVLDIDWLNDDGLLDVAIEAYNYGWLGKATAWLDHSRLSGTAVLRASPGLATTSIPEPGTLALLGAGLLGIGAYYRRHRV